MKAFISLVATAFLLTLALAIIFQQSKSDELSSIQEIQQLLSNMKAQEGYLDRDMLKIHHGDITHYDPLNHAQKAILHIKTQLQPLTRTYDKALFESFEINCQLQGAALELFLANQAVLTNSLRYLPKAITAASLSSPQHRHHYTQLHLDLLSYLRNPDATHAPHVHANAYKLHAQPALRKHVNQIIHQHQNVRLAILSFHQASLYPSIEQLSLHLEQQLKATISYMESYQLALLVLSLLLVTTIIGIIWLLIRKSKHLRAAVRRADGLQLAMDNHSIVAMTDLYGRITYVNDRFSSVSGYSKNELLNQDHRILNSNHHPQTFFTTMWDTIRQGKTWHGIVRNQKKNGQHYWVQSTITPLLNEQGKPYQYIGVRTDITPLIQAQKEKGRHHKQLEYAQRLESLGMLASGIAHDFNNILTAIMGNAGLIDRYMDANHPAKRKLQRIVEASNKAAHLCKQMLAYSGKGNFAVQPYSLTILIEDMAELIVSSIDKNTVLKYKLMKHLPTAELDTTQIQQAIMNLVANAHESMHNSNGCITIATGVIQADITYLKHTFTKHQLPEGDYVYAEVSDNGSGMNKTTLNKVFDPFFTTKATGRGLGMSALHGTILGHKGGIKIDSKLGLGTTVRILLPLCKQAKLETDTLPKKEERTQPKMSGIALVVDDDEVIREVASIILQDMGFEILEAENGLEAVKLYRQHEKEIRCVLLDMAMPKMNGEEAFHELRKINAGVRVIISSGYSEQEACQHFEAEGLAGFVQKPYLPDTLQQKIAEALQHNESSEPRPS